MYSIIVSPTFKLCLNRLTHFLEVKYSLEKAQLTKASIKKAIIDKLANDPFIAPVSARLVELGIKDYRQFMVDEHNIVFFRVNDKSKQLLLLAVMDTRQSIRKLLQEVMLLS